MWQHPAVGCRIVFAVYTLYTTYFFTVLHCVRNVENSYLYDQHEKFGSISHMSLSW